MPYTMKANTRLYHGGFWKCGENAFDIPDPERSSFSASWFTTNAEIASKFSRESTEWRQEDGDRGLQIMLEGRAKKDLIFFEFENDCFPVKNGDGEDECIFYKEYMKDYSSKIDARDLYPDIIRMKEHYDGAIAVGSIGSDIYDDYAIFDPSDAVKLKKVKILINDEWKDFDIDKGKEFFEEYCNQ